MSVRPNIQSLTLNGTELVVRGESADPPPTILQVVVVQHDAQGNGVRIAAGGAETIVPGWRATLKNTQFRKGAAQTMGVEIRVSPFDIRSWVQSLDIE